MKTNYSLTVLCLLFITANLFAQDKIWIGPIGGSWGVDTHWSPLGVPSTQDVIIPSGSEVDVDVTAFLGALTVEPNAVVNKTTNLAFTMSGGVFEANSILNFEAGNINNANADGGLIFNGEVNVIGPDRKRFGGNVIINNTIDIQQGVFDFNLRSNILLISPGATMTVGDGLIQIKASTATLRNEGVIEKTAGTGSFTIDTLFENNDGTINVDSGSLILSNNAILTNGEYNVDGDASLILDPSTHFINETLTGQLDTPFIINSTFLVTNNGESFLEFSGPAGIEWRGGTLSAQGAPGSTLVNRTPITITGTGAQI